MRVYPNQSLAAHVLGYVAAEEREVDEMPVRRSLDATGSSAASTPNWPECAAGG